MKTKFPEKSQRPLFTIRVHLTDGSVESFAPASETEAKKLWDQIEPSRLFAQSRLILAGECSKSVFVTAHIWGCQPRPSGGLYRLSRCRGSSRRHLVCRTTLK